MQSQSVRARGLIAATVFLALNGLAAGRATAGVVAYAYAQQMISNVVISPNSATTLTVVNPLTTGTGDAASANGSGISHNNSTDALQSYVGTPPAPAENDFGKYATFGAASPFPVDTAPTGLTGGGTLDNFTRGDVLISGLGSNAAETNGVAESYLNSVSGGNEATSSSSFSASLSFTTTTATALNLSYAYANDIYVYTAGGGQAQATYKFNVTIKNELGVSVFDSATANTNVSLASPPNGVELVRSGTNSFTTAVLNPGETYTLTFSGSEATFVSAISAVPEPGTIAGAGIAVLAAGLLARRKRIA